MANEQHVDNILKFVGSRPSLAGADLRTIVEFVLDNSALLLNPVAVESVIASEESIAKLVRIAALEEELAILKG